MGMHSHGHALIDLHNFSLHLINLQKEPTSEFWLQDKAHDQSFLAAKSMVMHCRSISCHEQCISA